MLFAVYIVFVVYSLLVRGSVEAVAVSVCGASPQRARTPFPCFIVYVYLLGSPPSL